MNDNSTNNSLNVLGNDTDADNNPVSNVGLTIVSTTATDNGGVVTIASDNRSLLYTPAANFVGTETFTYTIRDPQNATDTATVTITVMHVNQAPTVTLSSTIANIG